MFGMLLGMSPFVEIDRTVTSTSGKIVAKEAVNTFQALDPSIITAIEVREGQEVQAGQLLATLDPTFATADVEQLRRQMAGLDAQIARSLAEQNRVPFAPAAASVASVSYADLQGRLFAERAAQLHAQILSFDEKIKATAASIDGLEADQAHLAERVKIATQIEGMRDSLYKSGSTSLLNLLQATDSSLEMDRSLESNRNSLAELQHEISSLKSDRDSATGQWFTASSQELIAAENQRDAAAASLEKALQHQDVVRLSANEPSVVLTLTKLSAGSVLKAGDPVMTLMPLQAPISAAIEFSADDIGFVRAGDPVTIKVDAFSYFEHGTAEGRLEWISQGTFTVDENNKPVSPFYKARVSIDKMNFINVPQGFRLIPGMTLTADLDVGRRSVLQFVEGTVLHGLGEALREP